MCVRTERCLRRSLRNHRMPIASISIFLRSTTPSLPLYSTILGCISTSVSSKHQNPNNVSRNKNLLKARKADKHLSSLSPALSPAHTPQLSQNQAIGMVASAQANFMRVIVQSSEQDTSGVELLCVVRALLKKIKRRVSVGDNVLVGSIDWVGGRGMIENVFERKSEILDPPVANVDHLLVFFSLDQPKLEPFSLTRFLVEAESTGIPLTLVLNKMELVDEVITPVLSGSCRMQGPVNEIDYGDQLNKAQMRDLAGFVETRQQLPTLKPNHRMN